MDIDIVRIKETSNGYSVLARDEEGNEVGHTFRWRQGLHEEKENGEPKFLDKIKEQLKRKKESKKKAKGKIKEYQGKSFKNK